MLVPKEANPLPGWSLFHHSILVPQPPYKAKDPRRFRFTLHLKHICRCAPTDHATLFRNDFILTPDRDRDACSGYALEARLAEHGVQEGRATNFI